MQISLEGLLTATSLRRRPSKHPSVRLKALCGMREGGGGKEERLEGGLQPPACRNDSLAGLGDVVLEGPAVSAASGHQITRLSKFRQQ